MAYGSFYENLDLPFHLSCHRPSSLAIGHFFRFIYQHLTLFIRNPLRLVRLTVKIDHHSVAQGLDFTRLGVTQALLHFKAGVAHFGDAALTDNGVMELHGFTEVQVHVDKDVFKGQPIDFGLEDMLEIAASTHVEVVALRPVVDVVVGVKVAHSDLDGTGEHIFLINFVESLICLIV